jgi:hypothetical protein
MMFRGHREISKILRFVASDETSSLLGPALANMKMAFLKNDRLAGKRSVLVFFVFSWGKL